MLGKISGGGAVSVIQTLFRPKGLAQSGGRLFFVITSSGGNGVAQLCRSDGTPGGTVRLKRVPVGTGYLAPLADVGGALFLIQSGSETSPRAKVLWKSDGTAGGTVPVRALGSSDNAVTWPTAAGSRLFFTADDGAHGYEMWVSDGTEAGTFMVRDIHPPESPSNNVVGPRWPIALGRNILFAADDGTHGSEPWHSDGTAAGTFLVKDIYPGPQPDWGRGPEFWTNVGGTVYFAAGDGSHGYELWRSDGTEAGTAMVKDIATGRADSSPMNMTNVNGRLFFSAADREGGRELWALSLLGDGTPHVEFAASGRTAPESTGRVAVTAILSWPSSRDVVVPFTLSGTATRGVDYSVTAGAIVIRAGATSGSATVTVDDDALDEEEESVVLTMGTPANARQGALAETRLIIADDDAAPSVQFETAGRRLREGSRAEITLRLSAPSGRLVTVPFTVSGAASPGLDYDLPAGPIAIPAGATTAALLLRGHVDSVKEPDETVVIALGTPTNATKGARDTYTATIAGP